MPSQSSPIVMREVKIAARPEIVFQHFVDPERMARWLGSASVLDARPGGAIQITVAGEHRGSGQFLEVEPPRRIVMTWGWDEPNHPIPSGRTRVEVDLTPDGDGTLLRLQHVGLPADAIEDHSGGWGHYLSRLAIAATGGDPGPDPNATASAAETSAS